VGVFALGLARAETLQSRLVGVRCIL
jgi:hypothetical protein